MDLVDPRDMEPAQLGQPSRGHSLRQAIANRVMEVADRPTDGQPLPSQEDSRLADPLFDQSDQLWIKIVVIHTAEHYINQTQNCSDNRSSVVTNS